MKVINDVFIVPTDVPGLIAADMELKNMGNDTVQMRIVPNNLTATGLVINFSMVEMMETLTMFQRLNWPTVKTEAGG